MTRVLSLLLLALLAAPLPVAAQQPATAEGYPARPVKVIVPYPPGAAADIIGRRRWVAHRGGDARSPS
jgi:tripartite-type tricarboxylate transporter receptor subunit TctC